MRRSRAVALQLFRTKSPDHLIAEAEAPERQMKRTLGPLALTCIGIGAVIGAGIFSLTGTAAAGQTFPSGLETPVINFIQAWFSGTGADAWTRGCRPRHGDFVYRRRHRLRDLQRFVMPNLRP